MTSEKTAFTAGWDLSTRRAIVALLMLSLVVSVATRTFYVTIPHGVTVRSGAAEAMRQHLVRDAARWIPPTPVITPLRVPIFYPRVAPAGPPLGVLLLDESLYNRPPPAC